ncbi:hypothetical protein AJ78_04329 [Emergomyces pasteurianus Ep9510]|uniref:HNH nuclease domain-containing protein n=1 Tax=Emergomyces pasteurianus Ep9510 TaxID=1447872 RepID=A0A1J9QJL1_9EURO|nr:hypothetical protein AJ78_04329 [Emergomyces pasteurianus Ep9510]
MSSNEAWEVLSGQATDRINSYILANRKYDDKVIPTLLAPLEWLPDEDKFHRPPIRKLSGALFTSFNTNDTSRQTSVSSSPHEKGRNNAEFMTGSLSISQSRDSKFRQTFLQRDNYKCVVTRWMDTKHWTKLGRPSNVPFRDLEAAHIIPLSYASWNNRPAASADISKAWELLFKCFPEIERVGMFVENINDPSNGRMLKSPYSE